MFDKEAITALQEGASIEAASRAIELAIDTKEAVIALPEHFKHHDLEDFKPLRRRARGTMITRFIAPFAHYAQEHAEEGATVFVNPETLAATAVLNLGTPAAPGHTDNRAVLELHRTAAYTALLGAINKPISQTTAAEFLEDWAEHVQCFNDDGEIKPKLAIAAVRKITIESARKVESEEQNLGATRSAFESVQASSKDPLPTLIYFKTLPYADLAERTFVLRLGILTSEKAPSIVLRPMKIELHAEQMAEELSQKIGDALRGELPVMVGTYKKAE